MPHSIEQNGRRKRFPQKVAPGSPDEVCVLACRVWTVATDENDLQRWFLRPNQLGQLVARHALWHDDVGQQQINFSYMMVPELQRLRARSSLPNPVATAFEEPPRQQPNRQIVLNQKDAFAASASSRFGLECRRPGSGGRNRRQKYLEGRSFADLRGHLDPTLVLLDDAINRGQSQPGALAERFGGKERLKDVRQMFRGDAGAGVRYVQADELPRARLRV